MGNQPSEIAPDDQSRQKEIKRIDSQVAQKFGKTTNWNLKVVIRGDRNTGKSSLFNRLQGKPFSSEYTPTETLQSAHVSWNYRTSNDIVKLEVWDVVDAPKARKSQSGGLKLASTSTSMAQPSEEESDISLYDEVDLDTVPVAGRTMSPDGKSTLGQLDSSSVDVLRGTHAVVLLFNPSKKWSWDYVKKEMPRIPKRIQVLIMANFKDMDLDKSQVIDSDQVRTYIDLLDRPVYFLEASMQNCYGLKGLKTFLNLPFLLLQREVIETQLKQNTAELERAEEEYRLTTENDSYESYIQLLNSRPNLRSPSSSAPSSSASTSNSSSPKTASNSTGSINKSSLPSSNKTDTSTSVPQKSPKQQQSVKIGTEPAAEKIASQIDQPPKLSKEEESGGFMSRFFGKKSEKELKPTADDKKAVEELRKLKEMGVQHDPSGGSVDDFVPEPNNEWLDDDEDTAAIERKIQQATQKAQAAQKAQDKHTAIYDDDDDDDDRPNPAIANFADDLDDTDQLMMEALAKARAEKEAKAAQSKQTPVRASTVPISPTKGDSDDEDDLTNPMLAEYEDDLDFEDQQIKGTPAPTTVKVVSPITDKATTSKPKIIFDGGNNDDDDDDDGPNPALSGYSEDIDVDDFGLVSPMSISSSSTKSNSTLPASGLPTPVITPSVVSAPKLAASALTSVSAAANTALQKNPKQTPPQILVKSRAAKSEPNVNSSDGESDNELVAKDESDDDDDDDDNDFAGFVPKRTAATSNSLSDLSIIPDFNPLDADSEADADAFWASTRQPVRKPTSPSPTVSSAITGSATSSNNPLHAMSSSAAPLDPFAFGSSKGSLTPSPHGSHHKDKRDKHKHKHHKDKKDKHRRDTSSSSLPQSPQTTHSPALPPNLNSPPSPAPKKSVFYL